MISNFHDILDIVDDMYEHIGPAFKPKSVEISRELYSECMKSSDMSMRLYKGGPSQGYTIFSLMTSLGQIPVTPSKDIKNGDVLILLDDGTARSYNEWFLNKLAEDILLKGDDETVANR